MMQFLRQRATASLILTLVLLVAQSEANAIRPFVTDDARVVGARLGQVESWLVLDKQEIAHNTLFAIGPTNWLEITSGFTHGGGYRGVPSNYGITGGIFQVKALVRDTKPNNGPGLAFAAGVVPPFGFGSPKPDGIVYLDMPHYRNPSSMTTCCSTSTSVLLQLKKKHNGNQFGQPVSAFRQKSSGSSTLMGRFTVATLMTPR
jgi:hypothetical protein